MSDEEATPEPEPEKPSFKPIPVFEHDPHEKPDLMVVGDTFVAQTDAGEVRIPLAIARKTVRSMAELDFAADQLEHLLESRGDHHTLARLDEADAVTVKILTRGFFEAYAAREVLRLGGIAELLAFIEEHDAAVRFDFLNRGLSVEQVGETLSYADARALVMGLSDEMGSRTHAAYNGWRWPMSQAEITAQRHLYAYLNVHRSKDHAQPFEPTWPWPDEEPIDPELRALREKQLAAMSAFGPEHDE